MTAPLTYPENFGGVSLESGSLFLADEADDAAVTHKIKSPKTVSLTVILTVIAGLTVGFTGSLIWVGAQLMDQGNALETSIEEQVSQNGPAVSEAYDEAGLIYAEDQLMANGAQLNLPNAPKNPALKKAPGDGGFLFMEVADAIKLANAEPDKTYNNSDPFKPTDAFESTDSAGSVPEEEHDPLEDVRFTGFIDDAFGNGKVAMINVAGTSLVKRVGESFVVDGGMVVIKKINKYDLMVTVNGQKRTISLEPFMDRGGRSSNTEGGDGSGESTSSNSGAEDRIINQMAH